MSIKQFFLDESGLTVVEYVVAASLLVVALGTFFTGLGQTLVDAISDVFD